MIKKMTHVGCDSAECESELVCYVDEKIMAVAYQAGWWRIGDTDRCPKCARTKQVELDKPDGTYRG